MKAIAIAALAALVSSNVLAWHFTPPRHDQRDSGWNFPVRQVPPPRDHRNPPPRNDWRDRSDRDHGWGRPQREHESRGHRDGYRLVGSFTANGASEARFSGQKKCRLEVTSGSVSVNSVVVRRGGAKQPITVVTRFTAGQTFEIPVDKSVTGVRISTSGGGRYNILVK